MTAMACVALLRFNGANDSLARAACMTFRITREKGFCITVNKAHVTFGVEALCQDTTSAKCLLQKHHIVSSLQLIRRHKRRMRIVWTRLLGWGFAGHAHALSILKMMMSRLGFSKQLAGRASLLTLWLRVARSDHSADI